MIDWKRVHQVCVCVCVGQHQRTLIPLNEFIANTFELIVERVEERRKKNINKKKYSFSPVHDRNLYEIVVTWNEQRKVQEIEGK